MNDKEMPLSELRNALAHFVTGVTVITSRDKSDRPIGVTANSFNSVSLDPPLILWSIANNALTHPSFIESKYFGVNILTASQVLLSNTFARQNADKFEGVDWQDGSVGIPLIDNCAAQFECQTEHLYDGGDHTIIVGRIVAFYTSERTPLAYHRGGYATATPLPTDSYHDTASEQESSGFSANFLIYLLARARHQMSAEFYKKVESAGLGVMQWRVLASLNDEKACSLSVLVNRTLMDKGSLIDLLRNMDGEDLVRFDTSSEDVSIRPTGESRVTELIGAAVKYEEEVLSGTSENDIASLKSTLREIISNTN